MRQFTFFKTIFLSCFLLVLQLKQLAAQSIQNGDFESWNGNCPYNTVPVGWTNFSTNLGADKAGNCTGSVAPYQGDAHMNLVWYSSTGLIEGVTQSIDSFAIGASYDLGFQAINNQGLYSFGAPVFCEVYVNGNVIFTTPELFDGGPWTAYTASFVATNDTMTIGFKVKNGLSGTSGSLGIDAVSFLNLTPTQPINDLQDAILFPSPIEDYLYITLKEPIQKFCSITLINSLGQMVYHDIQFQQLKQFEIDFSQLAVGSFIVKINIDGIIIHRHLIKIKAK